MAFGNTNADQKAKDQQAKTIKESITKSENLLTGVLNAVQKKCRKEAALRDSSDIMCKSIQTYSIEETPTTRNGLGILANTISEIQDYRQAMIERMEARVIQPVQNYEGIIKQVRSNINLAQKSKNNQNNTQTALNSQLAAQAQNGQNSMAAQQSLAHATSEMQRNIIMNQNNAYQLSDTAFAFEQQKKHDVKKILLDYVNSEMQFYANALECLARCKPVLETIDPEADMVWFRQMLQLPTAFNGGLVGGLPVAANMNGMGANMGYPGQQMQPMQQMGQNPLGNASFQGQNTQNYNNYFQSNNQPPQNLQQPYNNINNNNNITTNQPIQSNNYANPQPSSISRNVTFADQQQPTEDDLEAEYRRKVEEMDRQNNNSGNPVPAW